MAGYVAIRKDVCAGLLLKTYGTKYNAYNGKDNESLNFYLSENGIEEVSTSNGIPCRGMLFNVTDEGLANDLIYTTPIKYPINGIPQTTYKESDFIIYNYLELDELLKYLKYDNYLTQNDLNEIYRKLIANRRWLSKNIELFGWRKAPYGGYTSGGISTIPMSTFNNLHSISWLENGKPSIKEPQYSLIKRKK